jgi:hypothetical protein
MNDTFYSENIEDHVAVAVTQTAQGNRQLEQGLTYQVSHQLTFVAAQCLKCCLYRDRLVEYEI